ncbi:MAG: helix-turn-helix transcriptional regulator [Ruminiclostridium sp.]|nr:helix-turn-helix transcriptional regulator [Ruminiclostridium sp.]
MAIIYKIDVMKALKEAGYTSYILRKDRIFGEATMTKFRRNEHINFENLNTLCKLLNCQPGDIIEYIPDEIE